MFSTLLVIILIPLIIYLTAATFYLLMLALAYFTLPERKTCPAEPFNHFAILVPAHNEELLVENLCQSLLLVDYPKDKFAIFIIADNCSDRTAEICRKYPLQVLERHDPENGGKGQALAWGLQQADLAHFDAVLIVDADNFVDHDILRELSRLLNKGEQAIQCYNAVGNRNDSWFTQILFVTRTINNLLYHHSKYKLGLSSYLMGNGICFTTELLKKRGWTAFTIGEDWEYYAQLLDDRIRIAFAVHAKVFHQESKSLNQATSQRLRWSSGRFYVAKKLGLHLLFKGIGSFDLLLIDSSLPLLLPNYSLLFNLSLLSIFAAIIINPSLYNNYLLLCSFILVMGQFVLLFVGIMLSGDAINVIISLFFAPLFLIWKMVIDLITITGMYRVEKWNRTKRHIPK